MEEVTKHSYVPDGLIEFHILIHCQQKESETARETLGVSSKSSHNMCYMRQLSLRITKDDHPGSIRRRNND